NRYPYFGDLAGPANDAQAFRDWVVDPHGGGLPVGQVQLILSPDFPADDVRPTQYDVLRAFEGLLDLAQSSAAAGQGWRGVGRRLSLYFAGQGLDTADHRPALLMANASPRMLGYHVSGPAYADLFSRAGAFDEILLFMDCCREQPVLVSPMLPPFHTVIDPQ